MINLFYSTVGMYLDIICLTLPVLLAFNIKYLKNKFKVWTILYIFITIVFLLTKENYILKYIIMFCGFSYIIYKTVKIDYKYLYLYVLNFLLLLFFDTIGFITLINYHLLIYSVIYKLLIIKYYRYIDVIILEDKLKIKILSSASFNLIIVLSLLIGGLLWLK